MKVVLEALELEVEWNGVGRGGTGWDGVRRGWTGCELSAFVGDGCVDGVGDDVGHHYRSWARRQR